MTTETPAGEASPASRRTTAHDHEQLAAVLGWTVVLVDKAVVLGVLPPMTSRRPGGRPPRSTTWPPAGKSWPPRWTTPRCSPPAR